MVMMAQMINSHLAHVSKYQLSCCGVLPPPSQSAVLVQVCVGRGLEIPGKHLPDGVGDPEERVPTREFVFSIPTEKSQLGNDCLGDMLTC
jgi:hypothetical protein